MGPGSKTLARVWGEEPQPPEAPAAAVKKLTSRWPKVSRASAQLKGTGIRHIVIKPDARVDTRQEDSHR